MNQFDRNLPRRQNDAYHSPRSSAAPCACSNETRSAPASSLSPSLAMAYVPNQTWGNLYETPVALQKGTIFAALDFPFYGEKYRCGNCACRNR